MATINRDVTYWGLHATILYFYTNAQGVVMAMIAFDDHDTVAVPRTALGV